MIESRTFTVPSQAQNAFIVMHELRERHMLCDVTITVDGQDFEAHKIVLSGCSPSIYVPCLQMEC